jgi:hypothetical protein
MTIKLVTPALAGLIVMVGAQGAAAYKFTPTATGFNATGQMGLGISGGSTSIGCNIRYHGKVGPRGRAKIGSVTFSGSDPRCAATTATNLPWKARAIGPQEGSFSNMALTSPVTGACGPGNATFIVQATGEWDMTTLLPGNCSFSWTSTTSPAIAIGP